MSDAKHLVNPDPGIKPLGAAPKSGRLELSILSWTEGIESIVLYDPDGSEDNDKVGCLTWTRPDVELVLQNDFPVQVAGSGSEDTFVYMPCSILRHSSLQLAGNDMRGQV